MPPIPELGWGVLKESTSEVVIEEEELAEQRRRKRKGKVFQAEAAANLAAAEWFCRMAKLSIAGVWSVRGKGTYWEV